MAESEVVFPKGMNVKDVPEVSFVDLSIGFKKDDFIAWLQEQDGPWVNIEIKRSRDKNLPYAALNTYKKS